MLLLIIIFLAGVLHGLGPDHLAAITVFGARSPGRLAFFSFRFALGHALVIAVAGLLAKFGASLMPPVVEARFDVAGGLLLVATGIILVAGVALGKIKLHAHQHQHPAGEHKHLHLHLGEPVRHNHAHGRFALLLGAFFAMGGFRALLTVAPIALAPALLQSVLRIAVFTLGIIIAMVAYGLASGSLFTTLEGKKGTLGLLWAQCSGYAVGIFSIVAGLLTLHEHIG
jgi:nickel/cobalt transporter (NicO) family protein